MAPGSVHNRQTVDLPAISTILSSIKLQMAGAHKEAWLVGDLEKEAQKIQRDAGALLRHAEKLVDAIRELKRRPSTPENQDEGGSEDPCLQQNTALQCWYRGEIEFGLAQKGQLVPTIHEVMKDWGGHQELGFFKVTIEKDVMRTTNPKKIGNSIVDALGECQSEVLQLSTLPKRNPLYGRACNVWIRDDQSSEFHVPDLDVGADELDQRDCRELFYSTVEQGSRGCTIPYLVIPSDSSPQWRESVGLAATPYVDCGERLEMTSSRIPGVHTAYEYFSAGSGSCTPMHVEDGFLGSMNFVLAGAPKVWLFVQPCFRRKLEQKARESLISNKESCSCSQFVRHLNKLLSPQVLDSWGIPYHIVACKAGEMVVTLPETYHQVVNAGANYSQAINFAVEPDWTGPPTDYEFCELKCNPNAKPITAAQLSVQELTPSSRSSSSQDEQGHIHGEEPENSQLRESVEASERDSDTLEEEIKKFIDETSQGDTPETPKPTPAWPSYPPIPGDPTRNFLNSRSPTSTPGDPTPDSLSLQSSSPVEREIDEEVPQSHRDGDVGCDGESVGEKASSDMRSSEGLADPAREKEENEADIQNRSSLKDGGDGSTTEESLTGSHTVLNHGDAQTPIEIPEEPVSESSGLVEVPLKSRSPERRTDESVEEKIGRLVEEAASFLPALEISRTTLERFRPRQWLNDEAILKTLETILPDKATPLIASFSIKNLPSSGLAGEPIGDEMPQDMRPQLVHDIDSTHLFIAYNVTAGSSKHASGDSGNHWILIVADFLNTRIHFFGAEAGAEEWSLNITRNVSAFINSFRLVEGYEQVNWMFPEAQPLYPNGSTPDNYNCGIAVISRAEAFIYPDKALRVTDKITPADLGQRLDELRGIYLECIIRRCSRVCDDEAVSAQLGILTPGQQTKKRPSPFPTPDRKKILVARSAFQQRSDASVQILETIPRSEAEQWKYCILRTAQNTGFNGASLIETFELFPNNALDKALRLLQCVCEVANQDRLFQLKDVLQLRTQPRLEQSPSNTDLTRLADLHHSINRFSQVTYVAQYQRYMSLALYHQWFRSAVKLKSQQMKLDRNERKRLANSIRNSSQGQPEPLKMRQNHLLPQPKSSQAEARLKEELVDLLIQGNRSRETARNELDRNIREGKILNLLLSPFDNRNPRTDIRFLCLFPLYESFCDPQVSRPSLDLMKYGPPDTIKRLMKPISPKELLNFKESLVEFFGKHLFIMRPELSRIDANRLPGGNSGHSEPTFISASDGEGAKTYSTIYLDLALDGELREAKPVDVARFFEPTEKTVDKSGQLALL